MTISVVILNWKRPLNLIKFIIPNLIKCHLITEIIISHGNKDTFFNNTFNDTIKIYHNQDWDLNKQYGLSLRFINAVKAKNKHILFIDDDIIPSVKTIINMYQLYEKQYPCIVSKFGRKINADLTYNSDDSMRSICPDYYTAPILLTSLLLVPKWICQLFFIKSPPILPFIRKRSRPMWNGEDIFISLLSKILLKKDGIVANNYSRYPIQILRDRDDVSVAISGGVNHIRYRSQLIKKIMTLFPILI